MTAPAWIALAALAFTIISAVVGAAVACILWVGKKFDAHEEKDQQRHEDNLLKFSSIEIKLATIIRNGSNGVH